MLRFLEIDDESFLGEDAAAHKGLEVSDGPLHREVFEVDFVKVC